MPASALSSTSATTSVPENTTTTANIEFTESDALKLKMLLLMALENDNESSVGIVLAIVLPILVICMCFVVLGLFWYIRRREAAENEALRYSIDEDKVYAFGPENSGFTYTPSSATEDAKLEGPMVFTTADPSSRLGSRQGTHVSLKSSKSIESHHSTGAIVHSKSAQTIKTVDSYNSEASLAYSPTHAHGHSPRSDVESIYAVTPRHEQYGSEALISHSTENTATPSSQHQAQQSSSEALQSTLLSNSSGNTATSTSHYRTLQSNSMASIGSSTSQYRAQQNGSEALQSNSTGSLTTPTAQYSSMHLSVRPPEEPQKQEEEDDLVGDLRSALGLKNAPQVAETNDIDISTMFGEANNTDSSDQPPLGSKQGSLLRVESYLSSARQPPIPPPSAHANSSADVTKEPSGLWRLESFASGHLDRSAAEDPAEIVDYGLREETSQARSDDNTKVLKAPQGWGESQPFYVASPRTDDPETGFGSLPQNGSLPENGGFAKSSNALS
jgi:hypothetical protein